MKKKKNDDHKKTKEYTCLSYPPSFVLENVLSRTKKTFRRQEKLKKKDKVSKTKRKCDKLRHKMDANYFSLCPSRLIVKILKENENLQDSGHVHLCSL